jgi:hypothetical protein
MQTNIVTLGVANVGSNEESFRRHMNTSLMNSRAADTITASLYTSSRVSFISIDTLSISTDMPPT